MRYGTLCEHHLFSKVFKAGKCSKSRTVGVYYLKDLHASALRRANPSKEKINRVGIALSGKFGCAVERNRAKRLIREAYRQICKERTVRKGLLIVILPGFSIKGKKTADVKEDMLFCFERLGLVE